VKIKANSTATVILQERLTVNAKIYEKRLGVIKNCFGLELQKILDSKKIRLIIRTKK